MSTAAASASLTLRGVRFDEVPEVLRPWVGTDRIGPR